MVIKSSYQPPVLFRTDTTQMRFSHGVTVNLTYLFSFDLPLLFLIDKTDETSEAKSNGTVQEEGGESGEIIPGASVVFATLEVCLCLLVRQLPALNPTVSSAIIQSYTKHAGLSDEASDLISTSVAIMAGLPELCSPAGLCFFVNFVDCSTVHL